MQISTVTLYSHYPKWKPLKIELNKLLTSSDKLAIECLVSIDSTGSPFSLSHTRIPDIIVTVTVMDINGNTINETLIMSSDQYPNGPYVIQPSIAITTEDIQNIVIHQDLITNGNLLNNDILSKNIKGSFRFLSSYPITTGKILSFTLIVNQY